MRPQWLELSIAWRQEPKIMSNAATLVGCTAPDAAAMDGMSMGGARSGAPDIPLVVDLDGTLVRTDLLAEWLSVAMVTRPLSCPRILLGGLLNGGGAKSKLTEFASLNPSTLPYRSDLLQWLRDEKQRGRRLVLATAGPREFASDVSRHLGIFDEVVGSEGQEQLTADAKRDALVERFGERGFAYVGHALADLSVWRASAQAHVAGKAVRFAELLRGQGILGRVFEDRSQMLSALFRAMRPVQWSKNLLVVLPLLAAHLFEPHAILQVLAAISIFSMAASGVYILNDLVDLQDDRQHPRKCLRPFASGSLPVAVGWVTWPLLLCGSLVASGLFFPLGFTGWLAAYIALTLAYSFRLKRESIADVVALAMLYTLRVIAGAAAIGVPLTFWMLSFCTSLFLSLALVKRYSELKMRLTLFSDGSRPVPGRGYSPDDLGFVAVLGGSAAYTSVLVLALYIQDPRTAMMYAQPQLIWLSCPIFLFWISRVWLIASRGNMRDDPVVFAVRDRCSWISGGLFVAAFLLAGLGA